MTVKVVIHAEVSTVTDLLEVIDRWVPIASEFDRERWFGFIIGSASELLKTQTEQPLDEKEKNHG